MLLMFWDQIYSEHLDPGTTISYILHEISVFTGGGGTSQSLHWYKISKVVSDGPIYQITIFYILSSSLLLKRKGNQDSASHHSLLSCNFNLPFFNQSQNFQAISLNCQHLIKPFRTEQEVDSAIFEVLR